MVASLVTLEFMPGRRKPLLLSGLGLAIFTFSVLAIGQNVIGEHEGVAQLFVYAGATAILFTLVALMPPYGRPDWLSGRGRPD
jgi:NADH:ubiquinone oxidoreductase subunit 6 (subunit J)